MKFADSLKPSARSYFNIFIYVNLCLFKKPKVVDPSIGKIDVNLM